MAGNPFLRSSPSRQVQPLGAPLRAASARARRSARIGCARQYESIASRGVGGTNGRLSARDRTADGKMRGNALVRRASDLPIFFRLLLLPFGHNRPPARRHGAIDAVKPSSPKVWRSTGGRSNKVKTCTLTSGNCRSAVRLCASMFATLNRTSSAVPRRPTLGLCAAAR